MRLNFVFCFICLCFLSGCVPHSTGPKAINFTPGNASLESGKSIYVAVTPPVPTEIDDTPAFIAAQFSKYLTAVSRESSSGDLSEKSAALVAAKRQGSDYLILLTVNIWTRHNLLSKFGHEAALSVETVDVKTEKTLNTSTLEARCYAMVVGLEQSPRECIRPQIDIWMQTTFNTTAQTSAQTDQKTINDQNRAMQNMNRAPMKVR